MRYSEDHIYEIRRYSREIGLVWNLEDIPRSKEQADKLLQVYNDCELIHRETYRLAQDRNTDNPGREQSKAIKNIDSLLEYLHTFDSMQFKLMAQLNAYKNTIDISTRPLKIKSIENGIEADIYNELLDIGFSKTAIKENILPVLKAHYKI